MNKEFLILVSLNPLNAAIPKMLAKVTCEAEIGIANRLMPNFKFT